MITKIFSVSFVCLVLSNCAYHKHIVYLTENKEIELEKPNIIKEYWEQGVYGKNTIHINELCKQEGYKRASAFVNRTPSVLYSVKRLLGMFHTMEITEIWCEK